MQNNNKQQMVYAGFCPRLVAFCIDSIIILGFQAILTWFTSDLTVGLEEMQLSGFLLAAYVIEDLLIYIVTVLYFVLFTYITGTTLGKRIMNLRVVNKDGSTQLSLLNVIYRESVGKFLCKMTVGIGYLIIGFDSDKRGLHDMLCDTQVIYAKTVKVYKEVQNIPARTQVPYTGYQPIGNVNPQNGNYQMSGNVNPQNKEYHLTDDSKVDIVDEENIQKNDI